MSKPRKTLRQTIPLQTRKILKKSFGPFIKILILGGIPTFLFVEALIGGDIVGDPQRLQDHQGEIRLIGYGILATFMFRTMAYELLYFLSYFYDMDEFNVVIRKGVISKKEVNLPFNRITDVYVDQDLLDVGLGLYDVHISTPTQESGEFAHIDGLNRSGAMKLKQMILERVNQSGEDAPQSSKNTSA